MLANRIVLPSGDQPSRASSNGWSINRVLLEPSVASKLMTEFARIAGPQCQGNTGLPEPLSQREQAILHLLAQGLTNPEIGYELNLAEGTVKNYITTILQKLGVRDRTQAALRARELGLSEGLAS